MINYCILAHTNPDQLTKLIEAIHQPGSSRVIIHLDAKSDLQEFDIKIEDVWFTEKRVSVDWGTFSVVEAVLTCLEFACDRFPNGYMILISGLDFPIQIKKEIFSFVSNHQEEIFLQYQPFPVKQLPSGGMNRLECQWYPLGHRGNMVPVKPRSFVKENWISFYRLLRYRRDLFKTAFYKYLFPPRLPEKTFYYSEMWWASPYDVVQKLLSYLNQHPESLTFYKTMRVPDETCLQTILLNHIIPNGNWKVNNQILTFIEWSDYRWPRPTAFRKEDLWTLEKIMKETSFLFARKFDERMDPDVIQNLKNLLPETP